MKKYDEYKNSGVEWIGEVPSHWEVVKIKQVCKNEKYAIKTGPFGTQLKGQELQPEGDVVVYNQRNVIDNSFDNVQFYVTKEKAKSLSSFYTKPGDILVTSRGTIGRAAILEGKYPMGILHPCLIAIRLNENKCLQKWLMTYVNETNCFKTDVTLSSNATTIDVIYTETLKNIAIPIPPLYEQQTIATYLDKKCGEIDKVISAQQKRIALLQELKQSIITHAVTKGLDQNVEMKDSGVEWIGEVPKHWEVVHLKRVLKEKMQYGANEPAESDDTSYPRYIRITDITANGELRPETFKSLEDEKAKDYLLEKGDVLFARSGATVGKTFLFNSDIKACYAGYLIKASCSIIIMRPEFLYYYTLSGAYECWKNSVFIQSTIQNIGADKYQMMYIPLPAIEEQDAIIAYAKEKCKIFDSSISKAQRQVALLQKYKQSLITEVVTGKRKVC